MSNKIIIIIIVVVAVVVVAAWLLSGASKTGSPNNVASTNYSAGRTVTPSLTPTASSTPSVDIPKLLAEAPGAGATQQQLKDFSAKVGSLQVDSTSVDLTSCSPTPPVMHVKLGKAFTLKNNDAVAHTVINGTLTLQSPPNSEKEVTPGFPGPGIFGYSCDSKLAGIFLVTP